MAGAEAPLLDVDGMEPKPVHVGGETKAKKLGTVALAVLIFYSVSGGPFGMEEAVKTAGPLVCLIGMAALPIVWSLPEALITAELAPAFPEAAGYVAWVTYAFGGFWGFLKGYLSWLSGVTDNALYPVLIVDYVVQVVPAAGGFEAGGYRRMGTLFGITAVLTYLNYRGLDVVGKAAILICGFSLSPFVVLVLVGMWKVDVHRLTLLPAGGLSGVDWRGFANIVFWNLNYFNSASTFAGDVRNPGVAYPRAMGIAITMVILSAALPLLVGIGATTYPDSQWDDGFFAQVGTDVVGNWLGVWIVLASAVSSVGMFLSEMSSDSFQLMGMAEKGLLPGVFAYRSKYGTPTLAILLSAGGILALVSMSFLEIVEVVNVFYALAQLLEFGAFLKLRVSHPELHRPYRIPLNVWGCGFMILPAVMMLFFLMFEAQAQTWFITAAFLVAGTALYQLLVTPTIRRCCVFLDRPHGDHDDNGNLGSSDPMLCNGSSSNNGHHSYGSDNSHHTV